MFSTTTEIATKNSAAEETSIGVDDDVSTESTHLLTSEPANKNQVGAKETISNEYMFSSPSRVEVFDHEVASILQHARTRKNVDSPRSLIDLYTEKEEEEHNVHTQEQDIETYIHDEEINTIERKNEAKRSRRQQKLFIKNNNTLSTFSQTQSNDNQILPPPAIKRNMDHGSFYHKKMDPNKASGKEAMTQSHISDDSVLIESHSMQSPRQYNSLKEDEKTSKFSQQTTSPSWKHNTSMVSLSSHDTSASGYCSLDYSSGTDYSHDTLQTSNVSERSRFTKFFTATRLQVKKCSIGDKSEQLPLIREDSSVRSEDYSRSSKTPIFTDISRKGYLQHKCKGSDKASRKKNSRKIVMAHILSKSRGMKQPISCNDLYFAILFCIQLTCILTVGMCYGPQAFGYASSIKWEGVDSSVVIFTYKNVIILALGCGIISIAISSILLLMMTVSTKRFIPVSLFLSMFLALCWSIVGIFFSHQTFVSGMGLVTLGTIAAYTFIVWDSIPFVTAQLTTALSAIKDCYAIVIVACIMQVVVLIGIVFYFFTCIGIYDFFDIDKKLLSNEWKVAAYCGLGISFLWSFQVMSYILKVTACGVVHGWWHSKPSELNSLQVVGDSFLRATTFSFGSVCLGSLFISPARFLHQVSDYIRPNKEVAAIQSFVILQEWIVSGIDYYCDKFCNWAFAYVAMYGYNYFEAGNIANSLIFIRGWKDIIGDELLANVLLAVSLVIGGVVGCMAVIIEDLENSSLSTLNHPSLVAFIIGATVGVMLSKLLFGVIAISVDAVVISFAGSPYELEENHPLISQQMKSAWSDSWPDTLDVFPVNVVSSTP